jgi:hypothetical protein
MPRPRVIVLNTSTGPSVVYKFDIWTQGGGVECIDWAWCGAEI